jgi:glycerol-3-phosphate dehydrogenase (NAD(P)+)
VATVCVLGAGSFGTCLAKLCAGAHDVVLWARDPEVSRAINRDRRNPRYLTGFELPPRLQATSDLEEAVAGRPLVICSVPSHGVRQVAAGAAKHLAPEAILVSTVKGIEAETGLTMHQVLAQVLSDAHARRVVCLSGPSFAREIAAGKPTVVTLAAKDEADAKYVQKTLSCATLRCYSNPDVMGVELGGALKNVIAIAVGISDGLELGHNARAALMTRGLAEITRLGVRQGASPLTFLGLAGVGDLILTCTGDLSRNRSVGLELGRGRRLPDILAGMKEVAEGVRTTHAACTLANRAQVEMPIASMVREVLDGVLAPADAVSRLMTRELKSETP